MKFSGNVLLFKLCMVGLILFNLWPHMIHDDGIYFQPRAKNVDSTLSDWQTF
jgi:hypothetical protein